MPGPLDENEVDRVLRQLQSSSTYERMLAVQAIRDERMAYERVVERPQAVAGNDTSQEVRDAAHEALTALGIRVKEPQATVVEPPAAEPLPARTKLRHFLAGFLGWYLVNGLVWYLVILLSFAFPVMNMVVPYAVLLLLCINGLVPIVLAIPRHSRPIALGVLAALALNFAISLILIFYNAP